jgi:hemolysin III
MKSITLKSPANEEELKALYKQNELVYYSPLEELLNTVTHAAGVLFGVFMLAFMLIKSAAPAEYATSAMSCICFIIMFSCSAAYHGISKINAKRILRRVDYSSINLTVIACGTGACLLYGNLYGYIAYGVSLCISLIVVVLCMRYFGKFRYLAIASNFVNGALFTAAFIISRGQIPVLALQLSISGFVLCLIGAVLFGVKFRFAHTIFHLFVLFGPICLMYANYLQL